MQVDNKPDSKKLGNGDDQDMQDQDNDKPENMNNGEERETEEDITSEVSEEL